MNVQFGDLWPVHPHRLSDELLSFWILRTAHANHLKLQTFTALALGRHASIWNRDIDRSASDDLLVTLSAQTGSSVEELRAGTIGAYESIVFERHNAQGNTPWVLPLGIYHRTRKGYGMQYCPACLFWDDETPYFRRRWRMAFATMCDTHGILLHDRCPQCEAPVIYFRNDTGHRSNGKLGNHTLCWECGFDLRHAAHWAADWIDAETYTALRSLLTFIDDGLAVAGPHMFDYANLLLTGLHRICKMLASASHRRKYHQLRAVISRRTGLRLPDIQGRGVFEALGLADRHRVLLSAMWLLMDWPKRFVEVCRESGLSSAYVYGDMDEAPYWLDRVLKCELNRSAYVVSRGEVDSAASYIRRAGGIVTRRALQLALGSRENLATAAYTNKLRSVWPTTDEEFEGILRAMDRRRRRASLSASQKLLLERDRAILLTMRATRWGAKEVLELSFERLSSLLEPQNKTLPSSLKTTLHRYVRTTRKALAGDQKRELAFVGNGKEGIGTERLAQTIRRLRQEL